MSIDYIFIINLNISMARATTKKEKARILYEENGMDIPGLVRNFGLTENTIRKWIQQGGWRKGLTSEERAQGKSFAKTSVEIVKSNANEKNKLIIEMAQPTLELAFENLHGKMMQEKNTQEFSNIRDYAGLIGKLMETIGKITGETSGDLEKAEVEVKRKTLDVLSEISNRISGAGNKTITATSEDVNLGAFESKVIN